MTDTMEETETMEEEAGPHSLFELANRGLDEVRRRIDEMLVRLDVGEMNVRGEVRTDLDRAVNMALVANARVRHLVHDFGSRFGGDQCSGHAHHTEAVGPEGTHEKGPARAKKGPARAKKARG